MGVRLAAKSLLLCRTELTAVQRLPQVWRVSTVATGKDMLIFVAVPNEDLRIGLQMYLQGEAGMRVTGIAIRAEGLLTQVEASQADVLILDWQLPGASMPELLKEFSALQSPPKIVVLATKPEIEDIALEAGADAFVGKSHSPDSLLEALHSMEKTT